MKLQKLIIGLMLCVGIAAQAQTSVVTNANGTVTTTTTVTNGSVIGTTITTVPVGYVAPSSASWLTAAWDSLKSGTNFNGATNWAAIPFASYDLTTKKFGGGAAILYEATPNFWAGVRLQSIGGVTTTAGVQAQLQFTKTLWGVNYTPFAETSVGIGSTSLYGSVGAGALIQLHTWDVWAGHKFGIGVIADYEHFVSGNGVKGNQINAGLCGTLDI